MTNRAYWYGLATSISVGLALAITIILLTGLISVQYSLVLFVVTPLFYGFLSAFFYGRTLAVEKPFDIVRYALFTTFIPCGVAAVALLVLVAEGLVCLVMAAPLIVVEVFIGALIAEGIDRLLPEPRSVRRISMFVVAILYAGTVTANPLFLGGAPFRPIRTSIEIAAPPEVVWLNVVSFSDLPPPKHWLFRTGIAYPLRAQIVGEGVGAVRYCEFTTGPFVEPIDVWDAPEMLRFRVVSNPAPMHETSPWGEIHPPHLDGFMESRQGEFRLTRLPDGGTRLEGTTWYRHGLGPEWYWTRWSDYIIHTIHSRVLLHIKRLSERGDTTSEIEGGGK